MTAQEIITYGCLVGACVAVGTLFIKGDEAPALKQLELDERPWRFLPGVFRTVYPLLMVLDRMGLGIALTPVGSVKSKRLEQRIVVGNLYPLTPQMIACSQILYAVLLAGMGGLVGFGLKLAANGMVAAGMVGFFMGWVLPSTTAEGVADRRQTELVRSLPFAIDLIGAAMRAGSNFGDAIRFYVTQGGGGALTDEFARLMKKVQLGVSLTAALEEMARRVGSKEFTGFVSAVAHSLETGAALVDTLGIQGSEMRRVRFNIAEQKAARAPSLMILPIALFIMPSVFIMVFVPVYLRVQASGMAGMFGK
jgi:tight adherence protein C